MALNAIKLIFSQRYGVSADDVTAESIISDLCTDSLELLELLMYIEEEFSVTVPDEVAQELKTVGDIVSFVEANVADDVIAEIYKKLQG